MGETGWPLMALWNRGSQIDILATAPISRHMPWAVGEALLLTSQLNLKNGAHDCRRHTANWETANFGAQAASSIVVTLFGMHVAALLW